ncbi:MAG TPA: orotate phosphoribosyltransferase [Candidatus Tyrphobacter sp.]
MTTPFDLGATLERHGALLEGHFLLSSGRHSDRFVQKFRILEEPSLLGPVAGALAAAFAADRPSVVVSAAIGGIVLGYEVARRLGTRAIFVEKERGMPTLRRGFALDAGDRVLVVEDVVTTGASVREVMEIVRSSGAALLGVGAIVRRGSVDFGVRTHVLLDLPLRSYDAAECPQCAAGEALQDPGSRRV